MFYVNANISFSRYSTTLIPIAALYKFYFYSLPFIKKSSYNIYLVVL